MVEIVNERLTSTQEKQPEREKISEEEKDAMDINFTEAEVCQLIRLKHLNYELTNEKGQGLTSEEADEFEELCSDLRQILPIV